MRIRKQAWSLCVAGVLATALASGARTGSGYVGSKSCVACHERHDASWAETTHSRFMRAPDDDETIAAAALFEGSAPIQKEDVGYVLGHMHKLVFLKEGADGLVLLAHQYNYDEKLWEPFDTELWNYDRAGNNLEESESGVVNVDWYDQCAGCHTTGYDREKRTFIETSIGCENCHGPGAKHVETTKSDDIVNPASLPEELGVFTCAQCHSRGRGVTADSPYPIGYVPGDDLSEVFEFDKPVPGKTTKLFWENGAARQHHAQYNEES